MAFEYFLYNTGYTNTIVDRGDTSFSPAPPYDEIYIDYFIPNVQPLYLYRESGGTIVINSEADINTYLQGTAPAPSPEDYVVQYEFTGATADLQSQINALTGSSVNIDTILTVAPSGATFTSIQAAIDSVTDATTDKRYLIDVYSGTYTEDISLKNYVFVKGNSLSTVKVLGDLTVAPFGFGFSKISDIEFITQDRPTTTINTIGLISFDNVVLTSNWSGNTAFKSVMNIEKAGLVQMFGDTTTMRLTDNYTGATQTRNYLIHVKSGSTATNFSSKNNQYQHDIYGNTAELGLVLHANPVESEITIDDYDFNVNLHGSAPTHLIKLKNIEGGNGEIEASDATTIIDSDNVANISVLSAYVSGATTGAYVDYTTSKIDWNQNIDDEDIYIGAAVTLNDGIRVLNVVFETEADTIPDLYTVDGNSGEEFYFIYNGVGTSYNSEVTVTESLILGGISGNTANKIVTQLLANSTGSLVSEFGIREFASDPENIIYSNTGWTGTTSTVEGYLNETTHVLDSITPTGYIASGSPIQRTAPQEITVFAGDGFIVNNETLKNVSWTGTTIDTTAFALGQWYIYVDIDGNIITSQSILDLTQYIQIGEFLQITGLSASVLGSGRNIENFGTKVMNNFDRTTAFIYDKGGKVGVTGITSVVIEFPPLKIQNILDSYDITETVYSTQGGTKFFTWFNTVDAGWIQNYDFYRHAGGEVNLRLWNDTSGVSNYEISGGSLTFTSGSTVVTAGFNLSTELSVGYYIYLQADGITYMNRIDGITGTTLTLAHTYDGSGGTGTALAVTALLPVPTDKYIKHLVYRDFNGIADLVYNDTYQDSLNDIKNEERFQLPGALGESVVRLAEVISSASELSYEVYLNDIRPIPHGDYAQTSSIENINIHGELAGLTADDHLQYSRTDGTRDITGIQSYDSNYTFTSDTNLITKKFVDDKKYSTDVITGGTFGAAQIPDLNASKISGGTLLVSTIPDLNASIITGGTLLQSTIPSLNANIITGGTFIDIITPSLTTSVIKPSGDTATALQIQNSIGGIIVNFDTVSGLTGFGESTPSGLVHVGAGTASIAPLKFNSGTSLSSPQEGAVEFDGTQWYGTITGDTRKTFAFLESPVFTGSVGLPTGTTIGGDNLIDYILQSGGSSGTVFVTTTDFNTYTGETDTRFNGVDGDIAYVSGVTDTKLPITTFNAYTGSTIPWTQVSKTGSDLADLETRNAEDLNYTNTDWQMTEVRDALDKLTEYVEDTQGSGRLAPENVLAGRLTQVVQVSAGTGYINYSGYHRYISWSATSFNMTGETEGAYYFYVDTNGDVQMSISNPDPVTNIRLGFVYWGGNVVGVIQQCGCVISSATNGIVDFALRQGVFIYDDGGRVELLTGSTVKITSSPAKAQYGLLSTQLTEVSSNDASTFRFVNYKKSVDEEWETNYYFGLVGQGQIPTNRWNDTTKPSNSGITTATFTSGSTLVTSSTDLTSYGLEDAFIFLSADTHTAMTPVSAVTWTGSQTNITLKTPYGGAGGTGTLVADYSLPKLPAGKYAKHQVLRSTDDAMFFLFAQTYYDNETDAKNGVLPSPPESIVEAAIKMAYIITTSGMTDLSGNIYDIRPLPYSLREGGQAGGGTTITVHGNLLGLAADDHLQYLRTDGTRNITGIQRYQSQPTFTTDLDVVSKKYVDDQDDLKLNTSDFNGFTGTTLPSNYYNKTEINNYTGTTDTRLNGIDNDIAYISGVTDNKLDITDFDNWSGTTLPANYYNKTEINDYTGATATLIGNKQDIITGAATTITDTDLTTNRALISVVGKVGVSTVTSTELSYVGGVTSAIQTQLNAKAPLASPALTGVPTAPTATVGTNTTQIATTAYYIGSAANSNPLMNNTVSIGTSTRFARQDHVHPKDTAKANLAGGAAFTGTITVPKPAQNDNTTCVATTSWYVSQAGTANPLVNGSVAVGTSLLFSRQDHVHPTDTSRQAVITGAATTITSSNLTTDRVLISNGSGKVAVSTVTSAELIAAAASVYGNEFQLAQSLAASTTSATTPQTKVSMTTTNLPAGTYKILVAWRASHTSISNSSYFDVTVNGTPQGTRTPLEKEYQETDNIEPLSVVFYVGLSGVNTIAFRYWNESNDTTVSDATIELIRVS